MLTGDRPTGPYHLGHYIGSLKNRVQLQEQYECIFIIADLHMLTTKNTKDDIIKARENARQLVLGALACGIDPNKATFYLQSAIPEINEIYTLFQSLINVARLERIPSLKEMAKDAMVEMPYALLGYPILQAADILSVKAQIVPVGKDNLAHLEITREIATKFNNKYKAIFPLPETIISNECTNLPGINGKGKMSKSAGNVINLTDNKAELKAKIRKMPTDPNRIRADIPGNIENNLVFLYHDLFNDNKAEVALLKEKYQAGTISDVLVKDKLVDALDNLLTPIRERYEKYNNNEYLDGLIAKGNTKVRKLVQETLKEMKAAMGFDS